ncbi:MAG: hypothetical protein OXI91_10845 [Chloroflexota bacterium]|nr:hypothetical protein [Chloroflexota bacterium]
MGFSVGDEVKAEGSVFVRNRHIKGTRDDAQRQLSAWLAKEFGYIGIERLRVKGLMKNHHPSKSLSDSALSNLLNRIEYKAR